MTSESQLRAAAKYRKEHIGRITFDLPKETIAEFNAVLEKTGDTKYSLFKNFVLDYIEKNK